MTERVADHLILRKMNEKNKISFTFNDKVYQRFENEYIAAALLAIDIRVLRYHEESGSSRGVYCNIGHCYECRVFVNGKQGMRACLTPLKDGMVIESGGQLPTPVRDWRENHG